jgi:hypothetical protein
MIRLIGTRWKYSNVWSRGVLIGRNSCKEQCKCTLLTHVNYIAVILSDVFGSEKLCFSEHLQIEYATQVPREMVSGGSSAGRALELGLQRSQVRTLPAPTTSSFEGGHFTQCLHKVK